MGERFQRFLNVLKKVKDEIKAEKKVSEAIKNLPPSSLLPPPPIFTKTHSHFIKQYQEFEEGMMREMMISKATYPEALERMRKLIGCPDNVDPTEFLRWKARRPDLPYKLAAGDSPDIPYGTPRWMSGVVGGSQGTQDTTEKKEPTQSLSGPLEAIRQSLSKGEDDGC